jgi:hypothetical protein
MTEKVKVVSIFTIDHAGRYDRRASLQAPGGCKLTRLYSVEIDFLSLINCYSATK